MVERQHAAGFNYLYPVDKDVAHGPIGSDVDQRTQRISRGLHEHVLEIDEDDVRFHPGRQTPDIVAHQRGCAPDGCRMKQIGGLHGVDVARADPGQDGCKPHFLKEVVWGNVSAESHIDAGAAIAAEVLKHVPVSCKGRGAMCDVGARPCQNVEIALAPPVQPGALIDENGMAERGVLTEDADFFGPLNRRYAVTTHHFLEFEDALRTMRGEWKAAFAGYCSAVAKQAFGAGIDLGRIDDPG